MLRPCALVVPVISIALACVAMQPPATTPAAPAPKPATSGPATPGPASGPAGSVSEQPHVKVSLVSESAAATPGQVVNVGLYLEPEKGWHLYWKGQNDSGLPIGVSWKLPADTMSGAMEWPAPKRLVGTGGLLDHVYETPTLLIVPITLPASAKPGTTAHLEAEVTWLVCMKECVLGKATVALDLPIATKAKPAAEATAKLFADGRTRMPKPWPTDGSVTWEWENHTLILDAKNSSAASITYFPSDEGLVASEPATCTAPGSHLEVHFNNAASEGSAAKHEAVGIVEIKGKDGHALIYSLVAPMGDQAEEPKKP